MDAGRSYKMTTEIPESIASPDAMETSIGTFEFLDGVPTKSSAEMAYDFLDKVHGMKAFLSMLPSMSVYQIREGQRSVGAKECWQICETNFFGWHDLTRQVLPVMRRQGHGRIVQHSSVLGFVALRYRGAYNASKFALEGLADTLRLELRGTGIHVSLVEPGPILSRFRANALLALKENIDIEHSIYRENYKGALARLAKDGPAAPFTLPPEAVLKKVVQALESRTPRARYYVTFPTYLFAFLKRILPQRTLDRILYKI